MKKVIPFKKSILFKTNLDEITSISLEDNLKIENNSIIGNFVVSGEYKMNDSSINTETFTYDLPVEINVDDKYNLNKSTVDVTDFYYEIVDNNSLDVNIEVTIDKMEEIPVIEEIRSEKIQEFSEGKEDSKNLNKEIITDKEIIDDKEKVRCVEEEVSTTDTLFKYQDNNEIYTTYSIYIVREGDSIESILSKYNIDRDKLLEYNDINELKIGDKIIIPTNV